MGNLQYMTFLLFLNYNNACIKVREEAAIRKAIKKAKTDEEEAIKAAARRKLLEEALEAERLERGDPNPLEEQEVIPEPVEEEAVEEEEPELDDEHDDGMQPSSSTSFLPSSSSFSSSFSFSPLYSF